MEEEAGTRKCRVGDIVVYKLDKAITLEIMSYTGSSNYFAKINDGISVYEHILSDHDFKKRIKRTKKILEKQLIL